MTDLQTIMIGVALLILLVIMLVLLLKRNGGGKEDAELLALKIQLEEIKKTTREGQVEMVKAINDRLDSLTHNVGQNLTHTAEKTAKSFGEIQERLKVIDEAQDNIKKLGGDIVGLQDILSNKQDRGYFGETQMADLVKNALPPNAYTLQATLSNGKRPDCMIKLPAPHGDIAIDCKFPLEGYKAFIGAADNEKAAVRKSFATDVLKHVMAIADKYMIPGETSDQAMMFLPSEAVYAELHANFSDVVEKSHKARVWIVSPTTLMATLHTARAVLKDAAMQEQAGFIQAEVGKMLQDVQRLDERVGKLATHFDQAERDIKQIQTSSDKINRRATGITEVELDEQSNSLIGKD